MNKMTWSVGILLALLALAVSPQPVYAGTGYALTITPSANGKVVPSPTMPATGYLPGDTVNLMATANTGFRFSAWSSPNGAEVQPGVLPVWGAGTIVMNGNKTISAQFESTDTTPPTGTIVINNNRSTTNTPNVTLSLTWGDGADGSGVARMRFSDNGSTWTAWESLAATRAYTLPGGDGHKTVRVQFLDKANNRSATHSDYIRLDTTPPTGTILINSGAMTTAVRSVTLGLAWSDGAGSGVTRMRFSDNGSTWTAWMAPTATREHMLPEGLGYHTVRVQYLDGAGNHSAVCNDYIKLVVPDPHVGAVANDKDSDYLTDAEEEALETNPANPDEDGNGGPDGVDLALRLAGSISKMPWFNAAGLPQNGLNPPDLAKQFPTDRPFVISFDYLYDCVWICPVCGQALPAGCIMVVNPATHSSWTQGFKMPLGGWHFLQHGSFSYPGSGCGNAGQNRSDAEDLVRVVTATSANMKAAQWIACGAQPKEWGVEILPLGSPLNGIRVSGPTLQYNNECEGDIGLGGLPYVAVNAEAHTLTLVAVGPTSGWLCPQDLYFVCGLQSQIVGMAGGTWTFSAPILEPPVEFTFDL